ncbi:MAG: acyl-[acyl-carrier-protein] thioesterase [Coriobacteriia bacterium]|nr:acyl-[acyl-carrier-protein] thioesterase [Coriobacteriia bacterium]MBS5478359.1 acyl-[acyl-carrier-protein] thioesterase [Coriobacteriia bacterium]
MYSFTSRVRYSEVDETGTLSIAAMLNYLQDCSLFQSEGFGVGATHAQQVGRRWLLANWGVEIAELPHFTDEIVVSTWATGFESLFAHRNFMITRPDGTELVRADTRWFMYDDALARPIRPPAEEIEPYRGDLENDAPLDMPPLQRRISVDGPGEVLTPLVVSAAHIDTNHHVNNAQYVAMALGVLPEGISSRVHRLDVQYCTAARLGDVVIPVVHEIEGGSIVQLCASAEAADACPTPGAPYAVVRVTL